MPDLSIFTEPGLPCLTNICENITNSPGRMIVRPLEIIGVIERQCRRLVMQGKVEICGVNTTKLQTLTQSEMDTLLRLAKAGDKKAREKLIEGNLRLVLCGIQRFDKRGESADDVFQVGCIGLM